MNLLVDIDEGVEIENESGEPVGASRSSDTSMKSVPSMVNPCFDGIAMELREGDLTYRGRLHTGLRCGGRSRRGLQGCGVDGRWRDWSDVELLEDCETQGWIAAQLPGSTFGTEESAAVIRGAWMEHG